MELSELNEFRNRRARSDAEKRVAQIRAAQQVGKTLSELRADPRWEVYGRYLEAERAKAEGLCRVAEQSLLNIEKPPSPQEEYRAKLALAQNRGTIEAFNYALNIAKQLIEQGEKATEILGLGQNLDIPT